MLHLALTMRILMIGAIVALLSGYRANAEIISACDATLRETNTGVLTDVPCTFFYILGPSDVLRTIGNNGIRVLMQNDVTVGIPPIFLIDPAEVVQSISGYSQVDAHQSFVITGGTGVGTFTGMGLMDGDFIPFLGLETESFDSNFLHRPNAPGEVPLSFSFTFGQPFELFFTDRETFSGSGIGGGGGTEWDAFYLTILDSNGNPLPNAVVEATSIPEPSTWIFLVASFTLCGCWRRYCRGDLLH